MSFLLLFPLSLTAQIEWQETSRPEDLIEFRAYHNGEPTEIFYQYDRHSKELIHKQEIDEKLHLILTAPQTQLWQAHPENKKTLESFFSESLSFLGEDIFSFEDLKQKIQLQIQQTQNELLNILDTSLLRDLKNFLIHNDIVEPLKTKISHDESRFDAFVLLPLETFETESLQLIRALQELARSGPRYPLEWFIAARECYSLQVRLSVLALLTHNHANELLLIRAVFLEQGREQAWSVAQAINQIYKNEREFWIFGDSSRRQIAYQNIYYPTGVSFLDQRQKWAVNAALKPRIYEPVFGLQTQNQKDAHLWLPYHQFYHFYGAFILSLRIRENKILPDTLLVEAAAALGSVYKIKTMGWNREQIKKMKSFYESAAEQVLQLGDLIH